MAVENGKPLRDLVAAVGGLASAAAAPDNGGIGLRQVAHTIRMAVPFISCLGPLAQMAVAELESKAEKFEGACALVPTIKDLIDGDIAAKRERQKDSLSRYLIRMKRGLRFASLFFTHFISTQGESLAVPIQTAYDKAFENLHGKSIRDTVYAITAFAPTKSDLLQTYGEDEQSAKDLMEDFINASNLVVSKLDDMFSETEEGTELLRMI